MAKPASSKKKSICKFNCRTKKRQAGLISKLSAVLCSLYGYPSRGKNRSSFFTECYCGIIFSLRIRYLFIAVVSRVSALYTIQYFKSLSREGLLFFVVFRYSRFCCPHCGTCSLVSQLKWPAPLLYSFFSPTSLPQTHKRRLPAFHSRKVFVSTSELCIACSDNCSYMKYADLLIRFVSEMYTFRF